MSLVQRPSSKLQIALVGDSGIGKKSLLERIGQIGRRDTYDSAPWGTYYIGRIHLSIPIHRPLSHTADLSSGTTASAARAASNVPRNGKDREDPVKNVDIDLITWIIHPSVYEDSPVMAYSMLSKVGVIGLCYKVSCKESLENAIHKWYPLILYWFPTVSVVLVGCQADLRTASVSTNHTAHVLPEDAAKAAREIDAVCFIEGTSFDKSSTRQVFELLAWHAYHHKISKERTLGSVIQ